MFVSLDTDSDGTNISVFVTEVGVYLLLLDVVVTEGSVLCL